MFLGVVEKNVSISPSENLITLPAWHTRDPRPLTAALAEADAAAPDLADLARRWLPRMPRRPQASQNIRTICREPHSDPMLLPDASTCPWVALNTRSSLNAITIDVDHSDIAERIEQLEALSAPIPDLVVDPWSGRCHAVLWLTKPVRTTENRQPPQPGRGDPVAAADYAGRLLAAALGGSLMPQVSLVKSPWGRTSLLTGIRLRRSPRPVYPAIWDAYEAKQAAGEDLLWITHPGTGPALLTEIIAALAPRYAEDAGSSRQSGHLIRRDRGIPSDFGRNCELFDLTRWWAYDAAETDTSAILAEATRINGSGIFETPLPASEVAATARSIGRFMRTMYRPRSLAAAVPRRDAAAGAGLSAAARRQLSGRATAADRKESTDIRIADAISRLLQAGRRITQAALAAESGVSLLTVKRRWARVSDGSLSGNGKALAGTKGNQKTEAVQEAELSKSPIILPVPQAVQRPGAGESGLPLKSSIQYRRTSSLRLTEPPDAVWMPFSWRIGIDPWGGRILVPPPLDEIQAEAACEIPW